MKRKESTREALLFAFADRLLSEDPGGRVLSFSAPPAPPLELPPPPSKTLLDQLMRAESAEFQLSLSSVGTHTLSAPKSPRQEQEGRAVQREREQVQRGQSSDERKEEERARRGRKRRRRGPRKDTEERSTSQLATAPSSGPPQAPAEDVKGEKRGELNQGASSKERAGPKRNRRRKRRRNANPKSPSGGSTDA